MNYMHKLITVDNTVTVIYSKSRNAKATLVKAMRANPNLQYVANRVYNTLNNREVCYCIYDYFRNEFIWKQVKTDKK